MEHVQEIRRLRHEGSLGTGSSPIRMRCQAATRPATFAVKSTARSRSASFDGSPGARVVRRDRRNHRLQHAHGRHGPGKGPQQRHQVGRERPPLPEFAREACELGSGGQRPPDEQVATSS